VHITVLRQKIFSEMRKRVLRISGSVVENPLKGYQNKSYYGAPWYFHEKHGSGIIGDANKLTEYVDGSKYMLILATKNPGADEWKEGVVLFNEKYSPLSVSTLTFPKDYPDYFFLGLLQVNKRKE